MLLSTPGEQAWEVICRMNYNYSGCASLMKYNWDNYNLAGGDYDNKKLLIFLNVSTPKGVQKVI